MIEFLKGEISDLTPTSVVLETMGIGFGLNISVNTYEAIRESATARLYVYEAIREDAYVLYGFAGREEREAFEQLVSVSGIGPNTARVILSSLTVAELQSAILSENLAAFKGVKGVGAKTAQRLIVELKDKIGKAGVPAAGIAAAPAGNQVRDEAVAALQMLGFAPAAVAKVVNTLLKEQPSLRVEQLIKAALKML